MRTFSRVEAREGSAALLPILSERPAFLPRALDIAPAAQRYAVLVATLVAIFTFFVLQVLHGAVPGTGADLRAVLRAARAANHGHDIYAPALQFLDRTNLRQILKMSTTPYVYPPPLALLTLPLTALPLRLAFAVWDALNVTMLAILFVAVIRLSRARAFRELVCLSLIYGFFPLDMGLGNGQIDLTITVLCLSSYLLYRRGRLTSAGIILGTIALIKPTVGIILLYFILRRAWPLVRAFIGTAAAGICLSIVTVGPAMVWEYREVVAGWANAFGVLPLNQSLHGQLSRLLAPALDREPSGLAALLLLACEGIFPLIAALLTWRLLRQPEPHDRRTGVLQFYAVLSVLMLGAPFTENMYLTWLLPGIGILLVGIAQQPRRPRHIVGFFAFLMLALPLAEKISWGAKANLVGRLASGIDGYGLTALCIVLCMVAFGSSARRFALP